MDELFDLLLKPFVFIFGWIFRIVFYLSVEIVHEYIAWSVGWVFCRTLSFGNYPAQGIWDDNKASILTNIFVSLTGYFIITLLLILAFFM
jgi:hypothetical protein